MRRVISLTVVEINLHLSLTLVISYVPRTVYVKTWHFISNSLPKALKKNGQYNT